MCAERLVGGATRRAVLAGAATLAAGVPLRRALAADAITVRLDW
jgi:hypothetical protein